VCALNDILKEKVVEEKLRLLEAEKKSVLRIAVKTKEQAGA
jgi:hypothetical protein